MRGLIALVAAALALLIGRAEAQTTNGVAIASSSPTNNIVKILNLGPGQMAIGQGVFLDPIARTMSGDCTISAAGSILCTKTNGVTLGTAATLATGTSGATIPLNDSANIFSALNTFSGHVAVGAVPPVLTSCGTSPAILGDDKAGQVTMGTGTPTGCVVTFASAYTSAPFCVVSWQATPLASQSYAVSTMAITLTQTATSSNKVNYICLAQNGG